MANKELNTDITRGRETTTNRGICRTCGKPAINTSSKFCFECINIQATKHFDGLDDDEYFLYEKEIRVDYQEWTTYDTFRLLDETLESYGGQ